MKNTYMKNYWRGYRAAREMRDDCGERSVIREYYFGLAGHSRPFCDGWKRYMNAHVVKGAEE